MPFANCAGCGSKVRIPVGPSAVPCPKCGQEVGGVAPATMSSKAPLVIAAGSLVLIGGGLALYFSGRKPAVAPAPAPALRPSPGKTPDPPPPPKPSDPVEAAWAEATTEEARLAFVAKGREDWRTSEERAKAMAAFLQGKGRADLAKQVAEARLEGDPESAWANDLLGRKDLRPEIEALAAKKVLDEVPVPEWERLKARLATNQTRVSAGKEADLAAADLAAVRKHLEEVGDPWKREAAAVLAAVRGSKVFARFPNIDSIAWPPYLVMAQRNDSNTGQNTKVVLENHVKFFQCLTGEFRRVMGEAGLPAPTVAEMGNPVLKAFVFRSRNAFDVWHGDFPQFDQEWLKGVRAYYAWGSSQFMMTYDTGAPREVQDSDTCVAFHEATHQLVHYYRRYYLTLDDRAKDPEAPEAGLLDDRLHGETHWFQEGFAELFGGAERISSVAGQWKLLVPLKERLNEWGNPRRRTRPQWTLEEVLRMRDQQQMAELGGKKARGAERELNSLFYAQSWVLHHLLYFGQGGKYRERYLKYVNEEMRCRGNYETFLRCMEVGEDPKARAAFLATLSEEWKDYALEQMVKANRK